VESLLSGGSSVLKLGLAAVAVIALLAVAFWALRRIGSGRLRGAGRGRQPRLGVIDSAPVDGRRRLVLVRRDTVEHLIMIGGPTDVVVEQNIVRAAAAMRETAPTAPGAAADPLPRPVPLGEASLWPLQPEPAQKAEPNLRVEPRAEPPRSEPRLEPRSEPRSESKAEPKSEPLRSEPPLAEGPRLDVRPTPPRERRARPTDALAGLAEELARVAPAGNGGGSVDRSLARRPSRPQPAMREGEAKASPDQNLSEMAQRLEAALRRPARSLERSPEKVPEPSDEARPAEPAAKPAAETNAAAPAAPASEPAPQKSAYDNLEEEMASLLGRPGGKP
jgi:flagellar protein FliO/FliZ